MLDDGQKLCQIILQSPGAIYRLTLGQSPWSYFSGHTNTLKRAMKTLGEIEAAICDGISRFEQDYMGRGPTEIRAHLLGDLVVVRLNGVLTAAEQHLALSLPASKGRDLLKQVRTQLVETARPVLQSLIEQVTGVKAVTLHHDISTVSGEEVVIFTLVEPPVYRDPKKR